MMSSTLSYPEVWLFERSVEHDACRLQLAWLPDTRLARQRDYCELWNCPPHWLSGKQLCEEIWNLWHRGELELFVCEDDKEQSLVPANASELHQLLIEEILECRRAQKASEDAVRIPFRLFYRITAVGTARWEGYAIADWSRYLEVLMHYESGKATTWSLTAMNEFIVREALDVYGSDVFQPTTIHWETVQVVHHEPWDLFPGKQLPHGVTLSVAVTEHAQRGFSCDEWEQVRAMDEEYHRRFREICHWYENGTHNHPDRPVPEPSDSELCVASDHTAKQGS